MILAELFLVRKARVILNEDQKGGKEPQKGTAPGKKQTSESVSDTDRNTGSSAAT